MFVDRCGDEFDLVLLGSCLILGLCLLECNLDFISVSGIYYVENTLISNNCMYPSLNFL